MNEGMLEAVGQVIAALLARDFVYDVDGSPLPLKVVRERLAGFAACRLYD